MYNKQFLEDIYVRKYIRVLFSEKVSSKPLTLTSKFTESKDLNTVMSKYMLHVKPNTTVKNFSVYLFKLNKIPSYHFKVHILRFQK